MVALTELFAILEKLKIVNKGLNVQQITNNIDFNIKILAEFADNYINSELQSEEDATEEDLEEKYVIYIRHILLNIVSDADIDSSAKEDLISVKHVNLCIQFIEDTSVSGIRKQLHPMFLSSNVFSSVNNRTINNRSLGKTITLFQKILCIKTFQVAKAMESVIRDYMAGIFTLFYNQSMKNNLTNDEQNNLRNALLYIWTDVSKIQYLRNILLFKSIPNLPIALRSHLHRDLLEKVGSKYGFNTFVVTLLSTNKAKTINSSNENSEKQVFEIISNVVSFPELSNRFQQSIIKQIFEFLESCIKNEAMLSYMGAGLLSLRKLYELRNENKNQIEENLKKIFKNLVQPEDLLTGLIVMENNEINSVISLLYYSFCHSVVECLPSELLENYFFLLLQLYYKIPVENAARKKLSFIIVRYLNNRNKKDLEAILYNLCRKNYPSGWLILHERITVERNIDPTEICLKIVNNINSNVNMSLVLTELLKSEEFHLLTYRVFLIFLHLLSSSDGNYNNGEIHLDFIQNEDELNSFLDSKYSLSFEIIHSLNSLISFLPLRTQIIENSKEILEFLNKLLNKSLECSNQTKELGDGNILIILTLAYEMLQNVKISENDRAFIETLKRLQISSNGLIQERTVSLLVLLTDFKTNSKREQTDNSQSDYERARLFIECREPYLKVYGIKLLVDQLKKKDNIVISNSHSVIAIGLTMLREKDSYIFLNCIHLFVTLINIVDVEVIDTLCEEYLNDTADIDYRLVVGEAIIKVCQELGVLCFKYRTKLLGSLIDGARSPMDEFRMSIFANLGQLCRILNYQLHNYFHELLLIFDSELTVGVYIPSKRAALLLLNEILEGIEDLLHFGDILLPMYNRLKSVVSAENCDDKMRTHAENGLKILSEKIHTFIFPKQQLQKDIKILGLKIP